jgi:hypothetical protein
MNNIYFAIWGLAIDPDGGSLLKTCSRAHVLQCDYCKNRWELCHIPQEVSLFQVLTSLNIHNCSNCLVLNLSWVEAGGAFILLLQG